MKKLNAAIAGYGYSAKTFHMPFILCSEKYDLKKIYTRKTDIEPPCGIQLVNSYDELMDDDIDVIVICTPNTMHYEMAEKAVKNGKHVIAEKPVCISSEQARALKTLAEEKKITLTAYQNRRLDGDFLTVKHILEKNMLGTLREFESHFDRFVSGKNKKQWKNVKQDGVNILYDLGVHLADQAYSLFGMPEAVYADFSKQRDETPDFDRFSVNLYYGGFTVRLCGGELVPEKPVRFIVRGTEGSFIKYGTDTQEEALKKGISPLSAEWGSDTEADYGLIVKKSAGLTITDRVPTIHGNYMQFYDNFYDAAVNDAPLLVSMEESVNVLRLLEAALKSAEEKRVILNTI